MNKEEFAQALRSNPRSAILQIHAWMKEVSDQLTPVGSILPFCVDWAPPEAKQQLTEIKDRFYATSSDLLFLWSALGEAAAALPEATDFAEPSSN